MSTSEYERAELDRLRSEWREALLAAREALRAEEGTVGEAELEAHEPRRRAGADTAVRRLADLLERA